MSKRGGVEGLAGAGEDLQHRPAAQRFDQGLGIIGDAAAAGGSGEKNATRIPRASAPEGTKNSTRRRGERGENNRGVQPGHRQLSPTADGMLRSCLPWPFSA